MIILLVILVLFIATMLSIATDDEKITLKSIVEHAKDNMQINAIFLFVGVLFEIFIHLIK